MEAGRLLKQGLSPIAGVTWWRFYFRLYPGAIKSPQIIEFLKHLMRHISEPLLVVWDGLPSHRSQLVRDFVAATEGALVLERLPAYAPELNPVEYLWRYWKHQELPNSATMLIAPFAECAAGLVSLPPSENSPAFSDVTILYESQ